MTKLLYGIAQVPSPAKYVELKNSQDALYWTTVTRADSTGVIVYLADGCTMSEFSGGGATDFVQYMVMKTQALLEQYDYDTARVAGRIKKAIHSYAVSRIKAMPYGNAYLRSLYEEIRTGRPMDLSNIRIRRVYEWIKSNLMFTLVGGYMDETATLVVAYGDSGYQTDSETYKPDFQNVSPYIGYDFSPPHKMRDNLEVLNRKRQEMGKPALVHPLTPLIVKIFPQNKKFLIFSDGMPNFCFDELWEYVVPHGKRQILRSYLFDLFDHSNGLKPEEGPLKDDVTIAAFLFE